jgi:hypothetical protein
LPDSPLEARLDAAVPEFMADLRASKEWSWVDSEESKVFTLLEGLRLYLLDHRRDRDLHARAWAVVEELAPTEDELLLNALMVGLLEGHWPRRDASMMGPRTRALWDEMRPPRRRGLLRRQTRP